jgi:hypothetical protein
LIYNQLTNRLEPVAETTTAPVITDAIPPVESKEETKEAAKDAEVKKEEAAKPNRRMSRFESFFSGKKPTEKAAETKEPEVAPISDSPPTIETTEPAAEAPVEAATETPVEAVEKKEAEATTPTKERKPSMLAGLKSFTQKVRSPSSEQPPAVAAPVAAASTTAAPAESSAVADAEEPATIEAPAATKETTATNGLPASPTDTKEKRRSSFFNMETIKGKLPKSEKKPVTEPSASTEEPAKTEAVEEAAKPVEETPVVAEEADKKSSEAKPVEKVEKEHKQSPLTQLGRRVSKVIRGGAKKETKPVPKVEETSEHAPKLPEPVAEPALTDPSAETEKPAAAAQHSIGDVVPEAVNVGTAPAANTTVSATA